MKRLTLIWVLCFITSTAWSQEEKTFSFALNSAKQISLDFEYPQIVTLKTWDSPEVKIVANLDINDGQDNDKFELRDEQKGNTLHIHSKIKDLDKIRTWNVYKDDDDDNESIRISKNGRTIRIGGGGKSVNWGTEVFVELEIFVPKDIPLSIDAKYGLVEVIDMPQQLEIVAKFGGADISLNENQIGFLSAETSWGQIFTNLTSDLKVGGDDMLGKRMYAELKGRNNGPSIKVETDFGNVFLRKN